MTDSPRHTPTRVPSNASRVAVIAAAMLLGIVGLAGPAAAQDEEDGPEKACELRAEDYKPSHCFDYEVVQECGALAARLTRNDSGGSYGFLFVEGVEVPDEPGPPDGDGFSTTWDEDYNGGSVEVTYYVVGRESDYFSRDYHRSEEFVPNWWDDGETVTVDTNCEDDEPVTTSPPRRTTTSTTPPETTTTTEATTTTEVTTTTEDSDVGGEVVEVTTTVGPVVEPAPAQVGGATLPRTGAGTGGLLLAASLVLGLGALLRTASRRLG